MTLRLHDEFVRLRIPLLWFWPSQIRAAVTHRWVVVRIVTHQLLYFVRQATTCRAHDSWSHRGTATAESSSHFALHIAKNVQFVEIWFLRTPVVALSTFTREQLLVFVLWQFKACMNGRDSLLCLFSILQSLFIVRYVSRVRIAQRIGVYRELRSFENNDRLFVWKVRMSHLVSA